MMDNYSETSSSQSQQDKSGDSEMMGDEDTMKQGGQPKPNDVTMVSILVQVKIHCFSKNFTILCNQIFVLLIFRISHVKNFR